MDVETSDATLCARGGWYPDFTTRPSAPALWLTTAFDLQGLEQLDAVTAGEETGYIYTRDGNPNHDAFAADLAGLEKAPTAFVASSGMGAVAALLLSSLRSGDHVVAARVLYGRTVQLLNHLESAFGVGVTYVDATDVAAWRAAQTAATKWGIVESLSNPLLEVADLEALAEASRPAPLLVDNTFATPCLLRPVEHGAKVVFHSGSKYLNGHGDVMLGAAAGSPDIVRRARAFSSLFGMNANPFECWLASRGLRTLPLRMQRVSETAGLLADVLARHPRVVRVYYPTLAEHASRDMALRLLPKGAGGMLSFEIDGGRPAVATLFKALKDIPFSPTLADARTTVSYPAATSHKFLKAAARLEAGITDGLVRLSVGLEDPADLRRELETGLASLGG